MLIKLWDCLVIPLTNTCITLLLFIVQELELLNDVLSSQKFVCGATATQLDGLAYEALTDKLPTTPTHVVRWAQHMAAFSAQQRACLPPHNNHQQVTSPHPAADVLIFQSPSKRQLVFHSVLYCMGAKN